MEPSNDREKRRAATLDKLAGTLEQAGFPHGIARVYAALTLAEGDGMATSELVEELGISKASISNAMQFLVGTRLAERYRVRGSREAHYRIIEGVWGEILAKKFAAISHTRRLAEEAMNEVDSPHARRRLAELHEAYAFFEKEFGDAARRWTERKSR